MSPAWVALFAFAAVTLHGCGGGSDSGGGSKTTVQEVAQKFFDCTEQGHGWAGCSQYAEEDAAFHIEAVDALPGPNVTDCKTVKDYVDWMADVVKNFGKKATYTVKAQVYDDYTNTALYYAVFMGYSGYVYAINMNGTTMKVNGMTKVVTDQYAFNNLPHLARSASVRGTKHQGVARAQVSRQRVEGTESDNPAKDFFNCCESGKGWAGCSQYVTNEHATFAIEAVDALPGPKVTASKTVKDYLDWMAGVVKEFGAKASYSVVAQGFDNSTNTAIYYAVFMRYSDYVYTITLDPATEKVIAMRKVWNDQYAFDNIPGGRKKATPVVTVV